MCSRCAQNLKFSVTATTKLVAAVTVENGGTWQEKGILDKRSSFDKAGKDVIKGYLGMKL